MVTLLITSFIILAFLVVIVYYWQRPDAPDQSQLLQPLAEPKSLFSSEPLAKSSELAAADQQQKWISISERAKHGEQSALTDAHALGDPNFYDTVLDSLTARVSSDPELLSLISFVTRAELPVNSKLARAVRDSWLRSPDRSSTAKTLHIVALSDDASLYNEAVTAALQFWREGRLPEVAQEELRALIEGEFWLLSSNVRSSGAGFLLKRTLARARHELSGQAHVHQ